MKISIVIAAYNAEKTIKRTLNSLLSQTYKNFEIIVVNDGSIDNTYNIVCEYQKKYSNIKMISQENRGLFYARYTGVKESLGEYITFVDADDLLEINSLEDVMKGIEIFRVDSILYKCIKIFEDTKTKIQIGETFKVLTGEDAFYKSIDFSIALVGCFKKKIILETYEEIIEYLNKDNSIPPNIEEVCGRIIVKKSNRILMSGIYYYINLKNSLSKIRSNKIFYHLESHRILGEFIKKYNYDYMLKKYYEIYLGIYFKMFGIFMKGNYSKKDKEFIINQKKYIDLSYLFKNGIELKKKLFILFLFLRLDEFFMTLKQR